jgi:hypothetical protein
MEFVLWQNHYQEGFCVIKNPTGVQKSYRLQLGVPLGEGFPPDVYAEMSQNFPKDIKLADNLYGAVIVVISKNIKEMIEQERVKNVELLPIKIINHKGRIASRNYFILNPLDILDCIDIDKSGVEWNEIRNDEISFCDKLVLKEEKIPLNCDIFRPKFWTRLILVRNKLAERLSKAGFTGLSFWDPIEYEGLE